MSARTLHHSIHHEGVPHPTYSDPTISQEQENNESRDEETFHQQEKKRYEKSWTTFTYKLEGISYTAIPVRPTIARPHHLLQDNRPLGATWHTIVRDAVCRLPNGKGTREELEDLVFQSQFMAKSYNDRRARAFVSRGIYRLEKETEPCVKWGRANFEVINLHYGRTAADYAEKEQQLLKFAPRN